MSKISHPVSQRETQFITVLMGHDGDFDGLPGDKQQSIKSRLFCVETIFIKIEGILCLSQWRGEPKISTALAPRLVDVIIV